MTEPPLPVLRARSSTRARRSSTCSASVAPDALPGARGSSSADVPFEIPHGTTVVAIRYADGVVMAGDRRATAGYTIASRRIEKVFPADDFSGVAIAGAAGPGGRDGAAVPGAARALREDRGRARSRSRARPTSSRRWCAPTCPPPCRASSSCRSSPASTTAAARGRVFSYDVTGGKYEEADFQTNGSGGVHARNWIKAGWREGMTRDDAVDLALRSLFAAADEDAATGGPDLVRRIFPTVAVIDADGYRAARRRRRRRRADGAARRPRGGARADEHAVLRLAGAGDEGPRRLRAEGHRPRPQPRRARAPPTAS